MKKLIFVLMFIMVALTACPQQPSQTFDSLAYFKKGFMLSDGYKVITKLDLGTGTGACNCTWLTLPGVPSTFPPSAHNHDLLYKAIGWHESWNTLLDRPTLFDGKYSSLTGVPTLFAPSAHTHPWTDVTGKPTEIELSNELPLLNGWELPQKSTAAINAMVLTKNKVYEVWDSSLGVKKVWTKGVWKTYITNQ